MSDSALPWRRRDLAIALGVAALMALVASQTVTAFREHGFKPLFYQSMFAPAIALACGHGFHDLSDGGQAAAAFLADQQPSLNCSDLAVTLQTGPLTVFQSAHRYLILLVGLVWSVTGVTWAASGIVSALLAAPVGALTYLLFRAGMGPALAASLTVVALLAPYNLMQMPHLRDYSKAPFFALTLFVMAWLVRATANRNQLIGMLAASGATLGVGFGMRTDVILYLPFILVTLAFFRPGVTRQDIVSKAAAAAAAVAAFAVLAVPVMRSYEKGDSLAHVALLGLIDQSRDALHLDVPPYSFGHLYDDGYQATRILAYGDRQGKLDAPAPLMSEPYALWGNALYREIIETFPADMWVRSVGAIVQVFALPFNGIQVSDAIGAGWPLQTGMTVRRWMATLDGLRWAPVLFFGIISVATASSWGAGVAAALACGVFPALAVIQYQPRHVFQLEVLPFFAGGCLLSLIWALARRRVRVERPAIIRGLAGVAATLLIIVVPLEAARAYQRSSVTGLLAAYELAPRQDLPLRVEPRPEGMAFLPVTFAPSSRHFLDSNMLSVRLSPSGCGADAVTMTFQYRVLPPYPDHSRQIRVALKQGMTDHLFPVYTLGPRWPGDRSLFQFAGIELPSAQSGCIAGLQAFTDPDAFTLLIEATLGPDWRRGPLHERLLGFEARR